MSIGRVSIGLMSIGRVSIGRVVPQVSIERVSRLKCFQRLNHFPGMLEICRKASLSRHLARMCARLPHE